jgi:hypothetical protein
VSLVFPVFIKIGLRRQNLESNLNKNFAKIPVIGLAFRAEGHTR